MGSWADTFTGAVSATLVDAAVEADIEPMAAYMRHQFAFMGVRSAGQKAAVAAGFAAAGRPFDEAEVVSAIDDLWARPEREYRYVGCHLARRFAPRASPGFVTEAARWITADPWWDTCDPMARGCVGQVVRRHRQLRAVMDRWLSGSDLWLVRGALLHMGDWKQDIDRGWVLAACAARAKDSDFFIRKAIGWILRDLAWVDPLTVIGFVDGPAGRALSGLSKREALRNVSDDRAATPASG